MTAPRPGTCPNVPPGETEPCGKPLDGTHASGGADVCAACREAADQLLRLLVAAVVAEAEQPARQDAA